MTCWRKSNFSAMITWLASNIYRANITLIVSLWLCQKMKKKKKCICQYKSIQFWWINQLLQKSRKKKKIKKQIKNWKTLAEDQDLLKENRSFEEEKKKHCLAKIKWHTMPAESFQIRPEIEYWSDVMYVKTKFILAFRRLWIDLNCVIS